MNIPTLLSISRALLCLLFFIDSPPLRLLAIILAVITDFLDGFLARRLSQITPLGTRIDPLADKLFVGVALTVFWWESKITDWEILLFSLRDISLVAFTLWLWYKRHFGAWQVRSFITGKLMTTMQFIALVLLSQGIEVPAIIWVLMGIFGIASFFELQVIYHRDLATKK